MTCGPRTAISPDLPIPSSVPGSFGSTMRTWVSGSGRPTVPYFGRWGGLMCVGAVVSERPYPSISLCPVISSQRRAIAGGTGAPPEKH